MERRAFGSTGLQVSPIALGGFPFGGVHRAAGWDPFSAEGRRTALATIDRALERGINYVDTAPCYGGGNSEEIIGDGLAGRRNDIILATKCPWQDDAATVERSIEASLRRLSTDRIDVIQFHGGMFTADDIEHILHGGPLDALRRVRDQGKVRYLGFTCEEPWTARPLIASGQFDMIQLRYNLIYQSAALHALNEARDAGLGMAVMRPMTSGMLQRTLHFLQPAWRSEDVYEVALKFVLSDSRVQVANVGMRWPDEVNRNVDLAERFTPQTDLADLPRMTAGIYRAEDEDAAMLESRRPMPR